MADATTPDRGSTTSTPRWVKVFVLIGILLILLAVVIMFVVGGDHGPGRHAPEMLTGFVLLSVRHISECPAPGGDTTADDAIPSDNGHK